MYSENILRRASILYGQRKLFKLLLGNLDTGLQVEEKTVNYRYIVEE